MRCLFRTPQPGTTNEVFVAGKEVSFELGIKTFCHSNDGKFICSISNQKEDCNSPITQDKAQVSIANHNGRSVEPTVAKLVSCNSKFQATFRRRNSFQPNRTFIAYVHFSYQIWSYGNLRIIDTNFTYGLFLFIIRTS